MSITFESELLNQIRNGDENCIKQVKKRLIKLAIAILKDYGINNYRLAKEIADEVIIEIYSRKRPFDKTRNVNGYLFRLTRNIIFKNFRQRIPGAEYSESIKLKDILPETTSDILLYELNDILDYCLTLLPEKERILMEGLINDDPPESIKERLGYKNMNVFCVRRCIVVAKFRDLLIIHGVDI